MAVTRLRAPTKDESSDYEASGVNAEKAHTADSLLRYQSDQYVSSSSRAIRQRLGVNLGDN